MQEPLRWRLDPGVPDSTGLTAKDRLRRALLGPYDAVGVPPPWLFPHQVPAWRRLSAILRIFRGGLLCDSVGLGKTYVALALGGPDTRRTAVVPASVASQWKRLSAELDIPLSIVSHEALSHGRPVPPADLILVDEAHRFRNPATRRYDQLARSVGCAALLLITATPLVNAPVELVRLVQLFLPDHGLALFGVPSLERAAQPMPTPALSAAVCLLMVARTRESAGLPDSAVPRVQDAPVQDPPPLPLEILDDVVAGIRELRFPSFDTDRARDVLHLHLLLRLSSSPPALLSSLTRHVRFLEGAMERGHRGERLSRREIPLLLVEPEERQLEFLDLLGPATRPLDISEFEKERDRMAALIRAVRGADGACPKQRALVRLLETRSHEKTIVFAAAVATATTLAAALGWRRVAAVTGRGAYIASGRLPINDALDLFAPAARRRPLPPSCTPIDVLVATDLASEGINLQDADAVVHYDIPWTPLRLQQRLGRVARLGSAHRIAFTWWFVPPQALEQHLQLGRRLAAKSRLQRMYGVPVSSRVGRGAVVGIALERRERLAIWSGPTGERACYASVGRVAGSIAAVTWHFGYPHGDRDTVPEVIAWHGTEPQEMEALGDRCALAGRILRAHVAPPFTLPPVTGLRRIVRERLLAAALGPRDAATRRIARGITRLARRAGRERRAERITLLDEVLTRITRGVTVGSQREVQTLLDGQVDWSGLRAWCGKWPVRPPASPRVRLDAVLTGDPRAAIRPARVRRSSRACAEA